MTSPLEFDKLLALAESEAKNPRRFITYEKRPLDFCREVLGVKLWEKQLEVLEATRDYYKVAVRSGHGVGKSFAVACLVLWWLYACQGLVITTAPTWNHVEDVLWREIKGVCHRALVPLPGEHLQAGLRISDTWYAIGLSTNQPSAFQGRHHPRLLVVVDEAAGVSELVHLEISTLATDPRGNRIVMIGNPTEMSGTFYDAFNQDGSWHKIHISCLEHPNVISGTNTIKGAVTREWVEEKRNEWGENHPFWFSRVLGDFPKISTKGVIPLMWIERAKNEAKRKEALDKAESERIPRVGGLDVARYGDNRCVLFVRRGDSVEHFDSWQHSTLTETAGRAKLAIQTWGLKTLVIDAAGLGAGVFDMLAEQAMPVVAYNGGHRAFQAGSFSNRRSELWWGMRQRFERQMLWLPQHCDKLVSDLVTPEYTLQSSGRIQVETKEVLLARGKKSPDFGDALSLCFAMDENPEAAEFVPPNRQQDQNAITEPQYDDLFGLPSGF